MACSRPRRGIWWRGWNGCKAPIRGGKLRGWLARAPDAENAITMPPARGEDGFIQSEGSRERNRRRTITLALPGIAIEMRRSPDAPLQGHTSPRGRSCDRLPSAGALAGELQRTTIPLRWVSERLGMGHYRRVSQAVSRMRRRPDRQLEKLRRQLARAAIQEK